MQYWTKDRQKEIVSAYETGKKVTDIAEELGVPRSVISGLLHSLGVVNTEGYKPRKKYIDQFPYNNYYKNEQSVFDYGEADE